MKVQKPRREKNRAKCKDCGSSTVHWRWLDEGWRLFDDEKQHPGNRYVPHCCESQPTAEGFDEEPT